MTDERIPHITERDQVPAGGEEHFDSIVESRGAVRGPFPVMLHSPEAAGRMGHLGAYIRFENSLPPEVRELAIITTARAFDCPFEWGAHARIAAEEGVREEAIEAVATHAPLDDLTDVEALVIRYGRELFEDHAVSDGTFEAALDRFGEQGVADLTATMGYYGLVACVLNAFEMTPDEGMRPLP